MPTPSRNASAVATASWPTIASMTKMISSGSTASRMSAACCHHLGVDAEPAGGVDDDDVAHGCRRACSIESRATCTGSPTPLPGSGAYTSTPARLAEHLELVDGVRALQVAGDQQRLVALALEPAGQLAGERGLAGALQAGEHDHGRRVLGELEPPGLAAEDATSSSLTILMICWAGLSAWRDLGAAGPLLERWR